MLIHENFGGIAPTSWAHFKRLAKRANAKGGRDGTKYDVLSKGSKSFLTFHCGRISSAAVLGDAAGQLHHYRAMRIQELKQAGAATY